MEPSGSCGEGATWRDRAGGRGSPDATCASNDLPPGRPRAQKNTGGLTLPDDKGDFGYPAVASLIPPKERLKGGEKTEKERKARKGTGEQLAPVLCCVLTGLSIGGPSPAVRVHPGSRTSL